MTAIQNTTATTELCDGRWRVDRQHSSIGFAAKPWAQPTVRGTFNEFTGAVEVRDGVAAGALTITAASLDTGNARRDKHLRSPDFFDVGRHPQIVFTVAAVRAGKVSGELAIGETRTPLELPVTIESGRDGNVLLRAETVIERAAVGLGWNFLGMIRRDAALHVELTLRYADSTPLR